MSFATPLTPVPEFIDPVFTKTSPKRSFSLNRKRAFWLVFAKTGSIISGTANFQRAKPNHILAADLSFSITLTPAGSFAVVQGIANFCPFPNIWSGLRSSKSTPKTSLLFFSNLLVPRRNKPKCSPEKRGPVSCCTCKQYSQKPIPGCTLYSVQPGDRLYSEQTVPLFNPSITPLNVYQLTDRAAIVVLLFCEDVLPVWSSCTTSSHP